MNTKKTKKHLFPAGTYVIGDPCYYIADEDWDLLLRVTGYFGLPDHRAIDFDSGLYHYGGKACFAYGTWFGDGCYPLTENDGKNEIWVKDLGVDAGLIGIMPVEVITDHPAEWLIDTHTFTAPFEVWYSDGTFHFSELTVYTKDYEDDEYD